MTLIIQAAVGSHVLHAADRLVSVGRSRADQRIVEVHDPAANKTLLLKGVDWVGTVGYTGPAYIGDRPTDLVLADAILDETYVEAVISMRASRTLGTPRSVAERVRSHLERLYHRYRLWDRDHLPDGSWLHRLDVAMLSTAPADAERRGPRAWQLAADCQTRRFRLHAQADGSAPSAFLTVGQPLGNDRLTDVCDRLLERLSDGAYDEARTIAVDAIVAVAREFQHVGSNVIAAVLHQHEDGTGDGTAIYVENEPVERIPAQRFEIPTNAPEGFEQAAQEAIAAASFAPLVLAPPFCSGAALTGSYTSSGDQFELSVEGPPGNATGRAVFAGLPFRRPPPGGSVRRASRGRPEGRWVY